MGRPPAIPDNLIDELVSRYGEYDNVLNRRRTFEDLAAWLRKKHGIAVSREADNVLWVTMKSFVR